MSVCGNITNPILINCLAPLVGGVKDRMILMNMSDISAPVRNTTNPQIIEGISKVTSKTGFIFEGQRNSNEVSATFAPGRFSVGYRHTLTFRVFGNSAAIKKTLEEIGKGQVVAFIENNYKGSAGESAFEVLGLDVGLIMTAGDTNKSDAETGGAYVITLATPDYATEPHWPASMFLTDYAATKTVFEGLLV